MIRVLIQDCHLRLRKYKAAIEDEQAKCSRTLGEPLTNDLHCSISLSARRIRDARESKLKQKLITLSEKNASLCHDNVVHNLSSKQLTAEQIKVLSHDACFNTTDAQPIDFIAAAEAVIREAPITEENRNLLRQRISSRLMSHKKRNMLSKAENEALRTLKADKSIVILPADKGRSTVVLNKEDYVNKVEALLGDRTAYFPCEGDMTKTLMSKINKDLASLRKSKAITQLDWQRMKPKDSAIARFYGLPKVHKPGTPLRPIVSLRGTPTFGLAKWLFQRLKFLTQGSQTTIHSAERFLEKLQGIRLTDDEVMVSFDVISLFTSIPQHLAVETVQTLIEQHYNETDNKHKIKHLVDLLKHCLKTFFTLNGATYKEVKGTLMGSPLSSLIAEAVLQQLKAPVFDNYRPRLWVRYVDDTFVINNRDGIGEFTQHLNSILPNIQFRMEEEKDCQLRFLDVLVQRKNDGGLKTTVYRKATNTSRILSFLSNHPLSHKRSCVRTLYRRVETHCTEPADKKAEAQFLRKLFTMNGYPGNFVEKCRRETRGRKPKGQPKPKCWRAVPYIAGLSEEFARLVSEFGIGVAHRPEATIRRQLMQPKDPIPINQKSGVIYRIDCNCGQASYVGETGKQVRTRLREHELAVRRNDKLSLVAAHASTPGHAFDFECVRILGQSDNRVARLLQEAWHSTEDAINRHIDLPIAYQALREQISSAAGGHPRQRGA
ncbi:hypothetical protein SprV_0200709800 [Sparganum proliferum]